MTVTWIHDEMLSPVWVKPDRPAVFVFDQVWIAEERLSLKRIVFLYESVLELPGVEVGKGEVLTEVTAFAAQCGAERIETARSVDPRIQRQGEALGVEWLEPKPFVELDGSVDLKRFSRFWRKAEKLVMAKR